MSNSWHEFWSTTNSKSETKSATKTKTTNTEMTLPGHTIAVVKQSTNNKRTTENYQQPVILNYKVAVFAMSGDYYNGASGGIENSRYDKQWMSVLFDGSDDVATSGCYALGSLYNRGITNKDTLGYDGAKGKYRSWCDKAEWSSSNKIDWNSISSTLASDNRKSHRIELGTGKKATTIGDLATELPLLERAQMLTSKRESVTSSVEQIAALYPLDSVSMKTGAKQYELVPRGQQTAEESDKLYLDQIKLEGYDKDAADFYEFDQDWGEWKLLDDEGNVIEDGGTKDESDEKGVVKSGLISIVTDENLDSQWVQVARASGSTGTVETHNIQWKIKHGDDAVIVSNESLNREDNQCMTDDEKDKVKTPVVEITVKNRERDVTNFEIDGTYKGPWNEEINLGHYISAVPVDQSGKISGAPVYWESKGTSGVEVTEDGSATFSKKGTYMVRPYSYNVDDVKIIPKDKNGEPIWIEVTANDKPQLSSIVINKPELDEDDATLTQGTRSLGFDLESYTKFYDQYGDKVEGTEEDPLPTIRYSVSPGENTQIDGENILTVTREGTYTVSAKAYDKDGNDMDITINPIKITVKEDNWLDSITFDQPAMSKSMLTLSSSKDYVVVENLKSLLTYTDQNEDEWTGKKPNVTFSVDDVGDDAEIKGGNFYAYAPGTYIIEAHAQGFRIDPISVVVTEESSLVLKTEDPGKQFLYTEEDSIDLELERYVDASTSFGGKWKGKVPALKFTLDSDVEDAQIETRTVYDGDDDYNGEDRHFFKTNTTGEFTVHVEPLKASEYSEPLDDMHIRVVKGKKIARIEFKNINEELGDEDRMVNIYNSVYPKIDLSRYINYYDGFGELIDPVKDHVRIPDVNIELIDPDDYPEGSYDFDGRVIKAYEGGTFIFKATMNVTNYDPNIGEETEDTILEAYTPISFVEIDWCHDFGEWETTIEPTCTEDGIRVKRCNGGDKCINHEKGECDAEIEDVIPATGHKWSVYYSINTSDHLFYNKCDHCGIVNEDLNTSYPAGFVPDNGYININGEYRPMPRGGYASCTGTATYYMENTHIPIVERIGVEVPAVGHAWDTKFTVVKEPSCVETGLEVIKCTRRDCNAVREGEEFQRIIPKTDHVVDESAWVYDESDGIEEKETCENCGWQKNKCTVCGKDMYRPVAPTGHNWYDPIFEWAEDKTILTATRTCRNDKTHIDQEEVAVSSEVTKPATCTEKGVRTYTAESFNNRAFNDPKYNEQKVKTEDIDATGHELVHDPGKEATCESDGYEEYWQCIRCNKLFSDEEGKTEINEPVVIKAKDHDWGEPEYTWAEDGSQCTATSVCKHDAGHVITETVNTTSEESIGATCDLEGVTLYTATFENPVLKTQTKLIKDIPAKGHDWTDAELEWNFDDLTCKATRTCKHDSTHVEKETVDITSEVISPATCDAVGKIKYKAVFENKAFGDNDVARKTTDIKALGHSWDDAVYTWADDNSKCTAKRVCERDKSHVEKETVTVTSRVVTPATCTEKGVRTYTAEFGNKAFSKQTKQEDIDELGHDWGDWKVTKAATETSEGEEQRTCKTDPSHVETRVIPVVGHEHSLSKVEAKAATCEQDGNKEYYVCDKGDHPCGRFFSDEAGT
ncbi:MAG: hypothetical protein J6D57_00715, partial [Mogibacterium sp.]|nr:hypothetical protein [Mogibacterium sp.]